MQHYRLMNDADKAAFDELDNPLARAFFAMSHGTSELLPFEPDDEDDEVEADEADLTLTSDVDAVTDDD